MKEDNKTTNRMEQKEKETKKRTVKIHMINMSMK